MSKDDLAISDAEDDGKLLWGGVSADLVLPMLATGDDASAPKWVECVSRIVVRGAYGHAFERGSSRGLSGNESGSDGEEQVLIGIGAG
jgi:hypothetical protein